MKKLNAIFFKLLRCHVEGEIYSKEEIHFQTVDLRDQHSTHFGIEGVVVIGIIKELGCQKYSANDNAVNIQLRQKKVVALDQPVNVYQSQDEALVGTCRVLVYSADDKRDKQPKLR